MKSGKQLNASPEFCFYLHVGEKKTTAPTKQTKIARIAGRWMDWPFVSFGKDVVSCLGGCCQKIESHIKPRVLCLPTIRFWGRQRENVHSLYVR